MSSSKLVGPPLIGGAAHFNSKIHKQSPTDQEQAQLQAKHLQNIVGNCNSMQATELDGARVNPFSSQIQVPLA